MKGLNEMAEPKDLVELIKANPKAVFTVDNDCWQMHSSRRALNAGADPIARDGEVYRIGDGGYGSGNCYGGDILQALAIIVGVKVESV